MEFKRLDKRKGSGAASIRSRYAYLILVKEIDYFPPTNEKGVRLEGDIVLKEDCTMIPVYLTNPSQEYSYETQGADDEKTFRVKFTGTHPGTELEALEFSKNLLEESFLILIPGCEKNTPGKLLGQINNPLIFTSTHKAAKDGDKFTFNFEQRIGSEYIYFSYGGVINLPPAEEGPPSDPGTNPGFDPTKWARIDASNIDEFIEQWKAKLGGASLPPGTTGQIYEIDNDVPEKIKPTNRLTEAEQGIASALTTLDGVQEEVADHELNKANKDASEMSPSHIISWQEALQVNALAESYSDMQAQVTVLQNWKAALTDADSDDIVNTLTELLAVMQNVPEGTDVFAVLNQKVNVADIVNTLTSNLTNAPLSAFQGKVLKGLVDGLASQVSANADAIATKQDKSMFSSLADKFLHYYDATAGKMISSGLKFVAGTINQLEFSGRIKSDGLLINETTTAILAREIKFKAGRFRGALVDGIERNFLLEGDGGLNFDGLVDTFFTENIAWMKPNYSATTYTFYNPYTTLVFQAGATAGGSQPIRIIYTSNAATLGRFNGSSMAINTGVGFNIYREFSIDTTISTQRVFVGYSANWADPGVNPSNVSLSTLTYVIGVCMESGNPNLLIIHNDTSGTANLIDTGFVHSTVYVYGLYLSQNYGETFITVKLKRFNTTNGATDYFNYKIMSDFVPANTHYAALWCVDELNTAAVKVSDFGIIRTRKRAFA